jgi:signal transduction histidine kinase
MAAPHQSDSDTFRLRAWWTVVGGWFGFFLLWTLFILGWGQGDVPVSGAIISAITATVPAALLGLLVWMLVGRFPWPDGETWFDQRVVAFVAAHVLAMVAFTVTWTVTAPVASLLMEGGSLAELQWETQTYVWRLFMGVLLYVIVAGLSYAAHINKRLRRQQQIAARAEAIAAKANLAAMRSQLQPHFLFNALHSISSLIDSDRDKASDAVELLGDLLRYAVRERETDLVSLDEEWQFVSDYIELQLLRFGDGVSVVMEPLDGAGQIRVPPFVLQPLVENAFVHGMEARSNKGQISISARRSGSSLRLLVEDNGFSPDHGIALKRQDGTAGTGLDNLRLRLESIYGDRAKLTITNNDGGGTRAFIELEDVA